MINKTLFALIVLSSTSLVVAKESLISSRESNEPSPNIQRNIVESRLFATRDSRLMRGEIALEKNFLERYKERQFSLTLETGKVLFKDNGIGADKIRGDGVFSAFVQFDSSPLKSFNQKEMQKQLDFLHGKFPEKMVELGPRNIVPTKQVFERIQKETRGLKGSLRSRINNGEQLLKLLGERSIARSASKAGIDIDKVPMFTFPGSASLESMNFKKFFNFPIVKFLPSGVSQASMSIDPERSLLIRDISVVNDPKRTFDPCDHSTRRTPGGAWTFAHLMREMVKGANPSGMTAEEYTLQWLANWKLNPSPNGQPLNQAGPNGPTLPERDTDAIVQFWDSLDGSSDGKFDINFFPARLMAIVNRPDLADQIGYSQAGSAGEGRFVFGLLNGQCQAIPFTVIFEYGIKGGSCKNVKNWHKKWHVLANYPVGSSTYKEELEAITRDFTDFGAQTPNESALNQLRTNENFLNQEWQLLEFRIGSRGTLHLDTVKQTPSSNYNINSSDNNDLKDYLIGHEGEILTNRHVIPEKFPVPTQPFLGSHIEVASSPENEFWNVSDQSGFTNFAETRRKFSLMTCNACHGGETKTSFTHIGNRGTREANVQAELSGFLTGIKVQVPVTGTPNDEITYNDLAARASKMSDILTSSCFSLSVDRMSNFVH